MHVLIGKHNSFFLSNQEEEGEGGREGEMEGEGREKWWGKGGKETEREREITVRFRILGERHREFSNPSVK